MSTLSVTTVTTGLSTTDLTLNTANTGAGDIVIQSDGLGMVLSGNSTTNTLDLAPNGHVAIANSTVNTFVLTSSGEIDLNGYQIVMKPGTSSVPSLILRNDGSSSYFLLSDAATGVNNAWSTKRPFQINNTTGVPWLGAAGEAVAVGLSSTIAATGYAYLPWGLKINWGIIVANNTSNATFASAFTTNAYAVTVTPITTAVYIGANTIYVPAVNAQAAQIRSASTTTTGNAYYVAIGI